MLIKGGNIDERPVPGCPLCNGTGIASLLDKSSGFIRCCCALHNKVCNLLVAFGYLNSIGATGPATKLRIEHGNYLSDMNCDCKV